MSTWRTVLHRLGYAVEEHFDALKGRLQRRLGLLDPLQILAYRGHGNAQNVYMQGRVLEDKGIARATDNDTLWQNVLAIYQHFESDEVPGVRVRAQLDNMVQEVVTDAEGYFDLHFRPTAPPSGDRVWHEVALELLDVVVEDQGPVRATGHVLIPPPTSDFGVISDVDDTIIQTHATSLLKMARMTLLHNAQTRLPFAGVAAFYQALQRGASGTTFNPIFYVSSSPWNLYELLHDFMQINTIPAGPLFLRDFGLDRDKFIKSGHHTHKLEQIEGLLATYPALPFILIGDSGQEDPEIYRQVMQDFPGRILAIYIRDVTPENRDTAVQALAAEVRDQGGDLLLVPDTAAAAAHAAARGFIDPAALTSIRAEVQQDQGALSGVEQLLE